jgi:hypothetical protein
VADRQEILGSFDLRFKLKAHIKLDGYLCLLDKRGGKKVGEFEEFLILVQVFEQHEEH